MAENAQSETQIRMPSLPSVELGDLSASDHEQQAAAGAYGTAENAQEYMPASATDQDKTIQTPQEPALSGDDASASRAPPPLTIPPAAITRNNTEGIGPSTDLPTPMMRSSSAALSSGPVIQFTLLLASTGTRHPYQINERYLAKRNVTATGSDGIFDPSSISVYTLKELILKDWREDWDSKPSSPSAIRLISFGQMLADNSSLKDCKLNAEGTPNVLHVTVKPQEAIDEEEAAAGKGSKSSIHRGRDGTDRTPGCRCVIL